MVSAILGSIICFLDSLFTWLARYAGYWLALGSWVLHSGSWLPPKETGLRDQAESLSAFYNLMLNLPIISTTHACCMVSPTEYGREIYKGKKTRKQVASETILEAGYQHSFLVRFFLWLIIAVEEAGSPPTLQYFQKYLGIILPDTEKHQIMSLVLFLSCGCISPIAKHLPILSCSSF